MFLTEWSQVTRGKVIEGGRMVSGIGIVFLSPNDEEIARELGGDPLVELSDATSAASPIPQYVILRFIPRENSSVVHQEIEEKCFRALDRIYSEVGCSTHRHFHFFGIAEEEGWTQHEAQDIQAELLNRHWIRHYASGLMVFTREGLNEAESYLQDNGRENEINVIRIQRTRLLKFLYDAAGGDERKQIDLEAVAKQNGLVGKEFDDTYLWLSGEGYLKQHGAGYFCLLTLDGKKAIEKTMTVKPTMELFYSYCHTDELLRNELEKHLSVMKRQAVITGFHDRKIIAGEEVHGKIDQHLSSARIILLLISADFLASDYCWDIEMQKAMERHKAGDAKVIPIILRPCDWHEAPFGNLLALPTDAKPVLSQHWHSTDEALLDVVKGIKAAVRAMS